MKKSTSSAWVFGATTLFILGQAFVFHLWTNGALHEHVGFLQSFGYPIPSLLNFALRTAKNWWLVPVFNALFLAFFSYFFDAKKWLVILMAISLAILMLMSYMTFPLLAVIKLGRVI
jgi:hypothetical protein